MHSLHKTLTELEKVKNKVKPNKASVKIGQNVTFTCTSDLPVIWEKKRGYIEDNVIASHTLYGYNVSIIHVRKSNAGKYVCKSEYDNMIYTGRAILKVRCKFSAKVEIY